MNNPLLHPVDEAPRLALRPREAAKALGISERTLWTWTSNGTIPHIRQGKTILYPTASLARWLDEQVKTTSAAGGGAA